MGLHPQTIGTSMPNGFAGSYARQPDMIVNTRPAGGEIPFGAPLKYDTNGKAVLLGASSTAADFAGVAARELKSSLDYLDQSAGKYAAGEAVSVFQRGCINVLCQRGTPKLGGKVYVRIAANEQYSTAAIGGFEAEADTSESSSKTVELTNCQWAGAADANGVAELRILTMNRA